MLENWIPEKVPLSKLLKNENNPRTITKAKLQKLIVSLEGVGIFKPIICKHDYTIIGGTQRNNAILQLMPSSFEVYVMRPPRELTEEEYQKVLLLDNAQYGEWQMEILANNFDISMIEELDIGINIPPIEVLPTEGLTDEDDVPDVKEPVVKKGDLWLLGEHRLLCGDSTMIDEIDRLMGGNKADMIFTDPPYRQETEGGFKGKIGKAFEKQSREIESLCNFEPSLFLGVLPIVFSGNKMNSYIFCNKDLLPDYLCWGRDASYSFNVLIWKKPSAIPIGGSHRPDIEYLLTFRKSAIFNGALEDVSYSKLIECDRVKDKEHPTMKPVEIITNQLQISSNRNSIVVDFFLGSGSTLIACEKTGRKCYGIEIDPHYCTVILNRWRNFTGKEPILESTGQTLKELESQQSA